MPLFYCLLLGRYQPQGKEDAKEKSLSPLYCRLTWNGPSSEGLAALPVAPAQWRSDDRLDPTALWQEAKGGSCLWEGQSCELIQEIKGTSILFR